MKSVVFSELELRKFTENIFLSIGCPESDALLAADVLIKADLRGIDSHGVARLPGYIRLVDGGRINPSPSIKEIRTFAGTGSIDGDKGLGLVVAPKAMEMAIEKAHQFGSGWVAIKNSNHFGIASYHAMMALKEDMIGFAFTNASPLVAPTRTQKRMLGTNPICYVFPTRHSPPIVIDMATSAVANGKIEIAQRKEEKIPQGWVLDKDGKHVSNPEDLQSGGCLLPLGSFENLSSHKGYCLSSAVDIFSGVLTGANFGPWVPPFVSFLETDNETVGEGMGHFVGAMSLKGFLGEDEFKTRMETWIHAFKSAPPIDPSLPVLVPGEPEFLMEEKRKQSGIPLNIKVYENLKALGERFSLKM